MPKMAAFDPPTHLVMFGQAFLDPPTLLTVTSFIVHEMEMGVSVRTPQRRSFQILQQILYGMRYRI